MAKAADVLRQLVKDHKALMEDHEALRRRVAILEALVESLAGEKALEKSPDASQSLGDDTWDPSRGPRPKSLRRQTVSTVANQDRVLIHRTEKKE